MFVYVIYILKLVFVGNKNKNICLFSQNIHRLKKSISFAEFDLVAVDANSRFNHSHGNSFCANAQKI